MWQSIVAVFEHVLFRYVLVKQEYTETSAYDKRYTFYYLEHRKDVGV